MPPRDPSKIAVDALTQKQAKAEHARLEAEIRKHDESYYQNDAPTVSDADYDALRRRYEAIEEKFPDLRTLEESGLPGFVVTTWQGVFAPAGTPAPVITRVNAEFVKAIHSPELRPKIEQQDMDPTGPTVKAFTAMYYAELKRWTKVAKDAGLKAE